MVRVVAGAKGVRRVGFCAWTEFDSSCDGVSEGVSLHQRLSKSYEAISCFGASD